MKIVIASDSFKGSLSSGEVADNAAEGIRSVMPDCDIIKVNVADGGEGTVSALIGTLGGKTVETEVCDPFMRPLMACYGILGNGHTAVIEMSAASGLPLLSPGEYDPLKASTFGTGQLIMDAISRGCDRFFIGIGGSATNDGGTGMLSALGFRFTDNGGNMLEGNGESLESISGVDASGVADSVLESEFTVACDVDTPFCGPGGAAFIFAPQKGADQETVIRLDNGMRSFSEVIKSATGTDVKDLPGAGAAGGLGGAFKAFLKSTLRPGADMILDAMDFDSIISGSDLVITGEGRIDGQTAMGKIPIVVLKHAKKQHIPVVAICGSISDEAKESGEFAAVFPIAPESIDLREAMEPETAAANVRHTVRQIVSTVIPFKNG
ncbi:MAG: glycerate kinase [Bacteroidales bacterium]|jgi:glycerate kinase|nr:glycerate kinase [Bacteroidales bacterium]MCI2121856.1 glycerate kinase [Bacteroidales bacterium]MCI2145121.1 glycerate kinase [Bacteroidales bacterium]